MKINYLCSFIFTWGLKYFLTVENQLIISIIQYLGRPPHPKTTQSASKFVPSCPTCRQAALRPTLGLRWRQAGTVCSVEYNP